MGDEEVVEGFDEGVGSVGVDDQVVGLAICRNSRLSVSISRSFCCAGMSFAALQVQAPNKNKLAL